MADETLSRADEVAEVAIGRGPRLVLVLEGERPMSGSLSMDLARIDAVLLGRGTARDTERGSDSQRVERTLTVRVPDGRMSSSHARLRRLHGTWVVEDLGSKNGTVRNGAPVGEATPLVDGDLIEVGHTFFLFQADRPRGGILDLDSSRLRPARPEQATLHAGLEAQYESLDKIARSVLPVLVLGESGTGKELAARAIHDQSGRRGAFVAVNCAALPDTLVESELFGAKKGAFTGADHDRPGMIVSAAQGTLFLDELGELPLAAQGALLRVLQEKVVTPVGSTSTVPVDFRLVAATHVDLEGFVAAKRFRGDLLARVSGYRLQLPALRDRREDLGLILGQLLARITGSDTRARINPSAARLLLGYAWPYNVRELEKALESAWVLAEDGRIEARHLPDNVRNPGAAAPQRASSVGPTSSPRALSPDDEAQKAELLALLEAHGGNLSAVSRATGKARMQIHRWLKRFNIDPSRYRE
jgi:DNA-binding NtrC family response regulator